MRFPECAKHLGPIVPGTVVPGGARVPGTQFELDPVKAAWDIGCVIRWLDYNDTWLAAEWGHPSDNLGGILAVADYVSRQAVMAGGKPLVMRDVLTAMIQAHEIQGCLALENSFNRVGLDHVLLVRVASTAVVTRAAWRNPGPSRRCAVARLHRRLGVAHLPACPQRRPAQVMGRRRCHQSRCSAGAFGVERRDRLPERALRADMGLL